MKLPVIFKPSGLVLFDMVMPAVIALAMLMQELINLHKQATHCCCPLSRHHLVLLVLHVGSILGS